MSILKLREQTYRLLEESLPNEQDADAKVRRLLEMEYLRRLAAYRHTDRTLHQKYASSFQEFVERRVVQARGFTFDVETDAVNWETAVSGIKMVERQLHELREADAPRD
jgi:hypothetical protein